MVASRSSSGTWRSGKSSKLVVQLGGVVGEDVGSGSGLRGEVPSETTASLRPRCRQRRTVKGINMKRVMEYFQQL